jgi:hypothetical protein
MPFQELLLLSCSLYVLMTRERDVTPSELMEQAAKERLERRKSEPKKTSSDAEADPLSTRFCARLCIQSSDV